MIPESGDGTVSFSVNGVRHSFDRPQAKLLDVLRNELGLVAARFGCGEGLCGACKVLVDGRAMAACDLPLWAVEGRAVVTLEGLGTPERPHALQEAFIAEQAMQCGYCISGIMITAADLLARNPHPDEASIRDALDRNLCRCGAHNRIVRAISRAAAALRSTGTTRP